MCDFLVDGYIFGGNDRLGHGVVTCPPTQRGFKAFVHTSISRVIGASGFRNDDFADAHDSYTLFTNVVPQGNLFFGNINECTPEVVKAMRACIKETGPGGLFSSTFTGPAVLDARGRYVLSQFGPLGEMCDFLVDGYIFGGNDRLGHGVVTCPPTQRGFKAFVHTSISRVIGASGIRNDGFLLCRMNECTPEVIKAVRACIKETGSGKLLSTNLTGFAEMDARGKYMLSQFGALGEMCDLLADGYAFDGSAVDMARRMHYRRTGHGAVASLLAQRGYTAFVHTMLSRVIGASGIHVDTASREKDDASLMNVAPTVQEDSADKPNNHQVRQGIKQTTPFTSDGTNGLRLHASSENLNTLSCGACAVLADLRSRGLQPVIDHCPLCLMRSERLNT